MGVHLKLDHNFFLRCLARRLHGLRNVETQRENAETAALDPTATWGLATAMDREGHDMLGMRTRIRWGSRKPKISARNSARPI